MEKVIPLHAFPGLDRCINQRMFAIILQLQSDLGKEDIDKLCPNILQIFDCLESLVVQRTGLTISEVAQLIPDETVQNGVKIFLNTRDTFNNLCTKGMPLNKAYHENFECLSPVSNSLIDCENKATETYNAYRDFIENSVEAVNPPSLREKNCMTQSYRFACLASYAKDKCGDAARDFILNFVKRTTFLKYGVCSPPEIEDLKSKFLKFIELSGQRGSAFADAFDFKRKK
ncbi:uncharacterized protein LOC129225540 isoform X2 [Uloborus diversus]|uniref:uncharacterized protein LOC129225540 isoform X2 n=1 Tax=Uloborus diversus TaxID=327109 RepID=UPI002409B578|nr:uncharacterized protein LOC129225540 isoform X2 [Uloborus diversus]